MQSPDYNQPVQRIAFSSEGFKISLARKRSDGSARAFHEAIEIKYFIEGRAMQAIGSDIIVAEPGSFTVANPYELHANIEPKLYDGAYYILMVDLDFFERIGSVGPDLRHILLTQGRAFRHHIKDHPRLREIFLRIVEEMEGEREYYRQTVYHLLGEFFLLLLREETEEHPSSSTKERSRNARLIAPALSRIFENCNRRISLDELAALCNVSKYHFCRIFKTEMGMTVVQYITHHRISVADAMMSMGEKSIREIADQCGFPDVRYFYRCYKAVKGHSPKNET